MGGEAEIPPKTAEGFVLGRNTRSSILGSIIVRNSSVWLWSDPASPALLRVVIDSRANAHPKMVFGSPITQMHPPQDEDSSDTAEGTSRR